MTGRNSARKEAREQDSAVCLSAERFMQPQRFRLLGRVADANIRPGEFYSDLYTRVFGGLR